MAVRLIFLNRVEALSTEGHFHGVSRGVGRPRCFVRSRRGTFGGTEPGEVRVAKIFVGASIRPYRKPTQVGA